MAGTIAMQTASYELPLMLAAPKRRLSRASEDLLLLTNLSWFCRLRWIVVGMLTSFGLLGFVPGLSAALGLRPALRWPFGIAAILAVCNVGFAHHALSLRRSPSRVGALANLWGQIALDLVLLTAVVHFVGSTATFVAFAYLFHIVLACIFFPRLLSLVVTLLASAMFAACVAAERIGLLSQASVLRIVPPVRTNVLVLDVASAILIWLVVWYLAAHLSELVRQRDEELAEANRRLAAAQEEQCRHMLTTTHQLKAPFAAIHAYIQLLLGGYCGQLPEAAADVVQRMAGRCRRLANEIQEMLQLASLTSTALPAGPSVALELASLIRWCLGQLEPTRQERDIHVDLDLHEARTLGIEDHFKVLFANILSNAIVYSHPGGTVTVRCGLDASGQAVVSIGDNGIGIAPEKLPHIFDEYYRTNEAVQHNRESSGLGLAIVRHIAQLHKIRIEVQSTLGAGTVFCLRFPALGETSMPDEGGN